MNAELDCKICKGETQPLVSISKITSSEFYCHECHKSYPMPENVAAFHIMKQNGMKQAIQNEMARRKA